MQQDGNEEDIKEHYVARKSGGAVPDAATAASVIAVEPDATAAAQLTCPAAAQPDGPPPCAVSTALAFGQHENRVAITYLGRDGRKGPRIVRAS
jgi:hypothetical protein